MRKFSGVRSIATVHTTFRNDQWAVCVCGRSRKTRVQCCAVQNTFKGISCFIFAIGRPVKRMRRRFQCSLQTILQTHPHLEYRSHAVYLRKLA